MHHLIKTVTLGLSLLTSRASFSQNSANKTPSLDNESKTNIEMTMKNMGIKSKYTGSIHLDAAHSNHLREQANELVLYEFSSQENQSKTHTKVFYAFENNGDEKLEWKELVACYAQVTDDKSGEMTRIDAVFNKDGLKHKKAANYVFISTRYNTDQQSVFNVVGSVVTAVIASENNYETIPHALHMKNNVDQLQKVLEFSKNYDGEVDRLREMDEKINNTVLPKRYIHH